MRFRDLQALQSKQYERDWLDFITIIRLLTWAPCCLPTPPKIRSQLHGHTCVGAPGDK